MNNKQIITIAAVVIIAVAAVAAAILIIGDGGEKNAEKTSYGSDLMVYGNANLDSVIDVNDKQYIQDYLDGKVKKTEFCDTNNDGVIDESDINYLQKLIDRVDGTKVYYVDGRGVTTSVEWPLNTFVVLSNSPQLMALAVGLDDSSIIGYTKKDPVIFKSFEKAAVLSSSSLSDYTIMTSNGVPDAIITQITNNSDEFSDEIKSTYDKMGTDVICVSGMDAEESASSALTLGFLVGGIEKSQQYSKWCTDMMNDVKEKVSTISERKTALIWFGGFACAGYDSAYTEALETAGGKTLADWTNYQRLDADNNTWILNYDPQYMIRIFTMGYSSTDDSRQALYEKYGSMINQMNAYKNGNFCVIDFTLPQTLRIAYMAEFMYPEIFGEGYADQWHQQLINIYGIDYKVDGQFMFTTEDLKS